MNRSRIWTLGAVVAVLAILGGTFALGVQPHLAAASVAKAATAQTQAQVGTTQIELAGLSRAAAKQADLQADADDLRWAIPRTLQLSTFSEMLRNVAALDGVKITALSTATAMPYAAPVLASSTPAAPSGTSTPAPSASASASAPTATDATGTAADVDAGWFGKTDPRITLSNSLVIPVTIVVQGEEAPGLAFAEDAQRMRRLFVASTITFAKSTAADTPSSTTISGTMYALKR